MLDELLILKDAEGDIKAFEELFHVTIFLGAAAGITGQMAEVKRL